MTATLTTADTRLISVAHSPDADDAFMFYALAKDKIQTPGYHFTHHLSDIETLNQEALKGTYELTAISYHAYAYVHQNYALLTTGSSIGDQYGPIVVAKEPLTQQQCKNKVIAVPGLWTTAYLALKLWMPEAETVVVPFDQILDRVKAGEFDAGLIIHEGQLTYMHEGLHKVVDLGEWWFEDTNLTLPLGGNAIRRDLGADTIQVVGKILRQSVQYGLQHMDDGLDYAMTFARDLTREQARRFIDMYVNDMTLEADVEIQKAVKLLLWRGHGLGLLPEKITPDFIHIA